LARPLIFDAATGNDTEITLDLPGETFADWYPDASALLVGHDHRGRVELYRYALATRALDRLDVEPGTIGSARAHPDGDVWYQWWNAAPPAEIRALRHGVPLRPGGEILRRVGYPRYDVDGTHGSVARPPGTVAATSRCSRSGRSPNGGRSGSPAFRSATTSPHTRTRWSRSRSTTPRSSAGPPRPSPSVTGSATRSPTSSGCACRSSCSSA